MNIVAHTHASTQGHLNPPSLMTKHFVRILFKYASFSRWFYTLSQLNPRNRVLPLREMPN